MPELPEVETVLQGILPHIKSKIVVETWADPHPRFTQGANIVGRRIGDVARRGKYLLLKLEDTNLGAIEHDAVEMVIHLGMTGVLQIGDNTSKHLRNKWVLEDGTVLTLADPRKFGRVELVSNANYQLLPTLNTLGPEPFSTEFTPTYLLKALQQSSSNIKTQLLAQKVVAGLGNIYVDETLWQAKIHPEERKFKKKPIEELHAAIIDVLQKSINNKGTTLKDYRTATGTTGSNQNALKCYGKGGTPCVRCGNILQTAKVAGRGTTFCNVCQQKQK